VPATSPGVLHLLPNHFQNVENHRLVLNLLRSIFTTGSNLTRHLTSMVPLSESDLKSVVGVAVGDCGEQGTYYT
jgi:hypothetical protein